MDTDDLKYFCMVADLKGFTAAARASRVEKSVVSKAVRRLEDQLGARLFERSTRQVRITEAGLALLKRGRALLEQTESLQEELRGFQSVIQGELRIAAPLDLGIHVSKTLIPPFLRKYPKLKVSLVLSYDFSDLYSEEIDVALRVGPLPSSSLISQYVTSTGAGLYASKAYLKKHGLPRHPKDLERHSLLGFRESHREEMSWTFSKGTEQVEVPVEGNASVRNFRAILELCAAGVGIARLGDLYFEEQVRQRGLQRILTGWTLPKLDVHLVYPSRDFKPRKVEAFLDFVKTHGIR